MFTECLQALEAGFWNPGFARHNAQEACQSLLKDLHWDLHCLVSCWNVFGTGVAMSGTCKEYVHWMCVPELIADQKQGRLG